MNEEILKTIKYVILNKKIINKLNLKRKRIGNKKVFCCCENSILYNKNKFFFQTKKGIIKFRGDTPEEIKNYKQYTHDEIKKIVKSSWGQWKR